MNPRDLTATTWRKSTYSNGQGGACIEVGVVHAALVAVRDSKNPGQALLAFPLSAWETFVAGLR